MWDLLTACLVAVCGLATYADFLLSKDQKASIGKTLVAWRDSLASTPLYQVPTRELRFALAIYDQAGQGMFRAIWVGMLVPPVALLVGYFFVWASPSHSYIDWKFQRDIAAWWTGSVIAIAAIGFTRSGTRFVIKRVRNTSHQAAAFVLWHLLSMVAGPVIGPAGVWLMLLFGFVLGSLAEGLSVTWQALEGVGRVMLMGSHFLDGLVFRLPHDATVIKSNYFLVGFTPSLLFWFRVVLTIVFVCAWLISPIAKRFAYLNIRSLADLERGHLTVAACGLATFIKGAVEIGKALLK